MESFRLAEQSYSNWPLRENLTMTLNASFIDDDSYYAGQLLEIWFRPSVENGLWCPMMDPQNELNKLIMDFEQQVISPERWHHREHLLVATWYLINFDFEIALGKIRNGIQKLNAANGTLQTPNSGYHESITTFLAYKIKQRLVSFPEHFSIYEKIDVIEDEFKDFKKIVLEFYSRELINSWVARTQWVKPDLKPLV